MQPVVSHLESHDLDHLLVLLSGVAVGHFALCFLSSKIGIALFSPYLSHRVFQ